MSSIISSGQSRQEYAIDAQLKILSNFNPPVKPPRACSTYTAEDLSSRHIRTIMSWNRNMLSGWDAVSRLP